MHFDPKTNNLDVGWQDTVETCFKRIQQKVASNYHPMLMSGSFTLEKWPPSTQTAPAAVSNKQDGPSNEESSEMSSTVSRKNEMGASSTAPPQPSVLQESESTGTTTGATGVCTREKHREFFGTVNSGGAEGSGRVQFQITIEFEDSELESTLYCPICKDFFSKPVSPHCGHTYCTKCLLQSIMVMGNACPMCRGTITCRPSLIYSIEHTIEAFLRNRREELNTWNARRREDSSLRFDSLPLCGHNTQSASSTQANRDTAVNADIEIAERMMENIGIDNIQAGNEEVQDLTLDFPSITIQEFWAVLEDEDDEGNIAGEAGFGNRNPNDVS